MLRDKEFKRCLTEELIDTKDLKKKIENKKVLFITTKELSYLRNVQEVKLLEKDAGYLKIIGSENKKYVSRLIRVYYEILQVKSSEFDIIFIGFAPQLILPFFYWKFRRNNIIIDFFISLYDTFVNDRKIISSKNILAKVVYIMDQNTLKLANYIIVDTKADLKYFIKEFGGQADKYMVLYLEANRKIFYPRTQSKPYELKDKFIVLYFGSILPLQGVDIVLEAVKLLKYEKDIFFQIIGPISGKYTRPIQNNVEYIEWLNQEKLAEYIANSDLCLAGHFNGNIDKAKRTIPGKAYIYAAMGKKIILGNNEANKELFADKLNIFFIEMGDAGKLKDIILKVYREEKGYE